MRKKRKLLALQHLLFFSVVCHSARFEIEVSLLSSDRNSNLAPFSRAHSNKQIQKHHHQVVCFLQVEAEGFNISANCKTKREAVGRQTQTALSGRTCHTCRTCFYLGCRPPRRMGSPRSRTSRASPTPPPPTTGTGSPPPWRGCWEDSGRSRPLV